MMDLDPLTRLAIRHGTDKWGPHFYTPIYHSLFAAFRDAPLRLLEIGIGGYGCARAGGASLAMWVDYFPHATIVGLDVARKSIDLGPRVNLRRGSQTDAATLGRLCDEFGPFDIVIDDGCHVPQATVISFEALFPRMTANGIYVIEDMQTAFWPSFGGAAPEGGATVELASALLRQLHHAEIAAVLPDWHPGPLARSIRCVRAYHNLLVIERGDNSEPSNFGLSLDDRHFSSALSSIERELEAAPTASGFANLARMLFKVGDAERAERVIRHALAGWPDDPNVLMVGIDIVTAPAERLALLERLAQGEPGSSRQKVERARAAILRGEPAARQWNFGNADAGDDA